ncbi:MAG: GTP 3',8-cyclase MoaA [Bacteroidetes bacterium]|nr:GTP 3',8-cyclase MoaA [Bacteroidota bacterium]
MKDQYGRMVTYLRISVTDTCNLKCQYCMPDTKIKYLDKKNILTFEEIEKIAKIFVDSGVKKIRITGGEPLIRKDISVLINRLDKLQSLNELAITTNGVFLKKYAQKLKHTKMKTINISLDTLDKNKYAKITRNDCFDDVWAGIDKVIKLGFASIKINTVLIKGINDNEIMDFINLTKNKNIDVRFIELMPMGSMLNWSMEHFCPNKTVLDICKNLEKIEKNNIHSPATYYKLQNAQGRVGLISAVSNKFCETCNKVRLTADGKLKSCLHSDTTLDLKKILRNGGEIEEIIQKHIYYQKPKEHNLDKSEYITKDMFRIGG